MRRIDYIVLHCTATSQKATVKGIFAGWKARGWTNPGYHFLIMPDGTVHNLQPIEKQSNGVQGYNKNSIHISYVGGVNSSNVPMDNRTPEQKQKMIELIKDMSTRFPDARILGHRDFPGVKKACPSFDVKKWLEEVSEREQIEERKNTIYKSPIYEELLFEKNRRP